MQNNKKRKDTGSEFGGVRERCMKKQKGEASLRSTKRLWNREGAKKVTGKMD